MLDALVDTLMALWNATWREKVVPAFFAFLAVGISTFLFLMQIGLPSFSRLSSASGHSGLQGQSGRSVSLAINPHVTGSVQAIAVPTPAQTSRNTKNSPTPTSVPTQASDTIYPPTPIPAPMPVQLPGIVSQPGIYGSTYTGTIDIISTDATPTKSGAHAPIRHNASQPTATVVPSIVVTPTVISPTTATTTTGTITPTLSSTPITVVTSTSPPTTIVGATPTVVVPTNAPTPTSPTPVYPATPISEGDPANTATVSPAIVPTNTGRLQTTAVVSPTPTVTSLSVTAPVG